MSEKVQKFLTRMGNIWPIPKRIDDEAIGDFLADWESALKEFDPWIIDAAATRIVHDRSSDRFPLPAEVRKVCYQVRADDHQSKPQFTATKLPSDPYALAAELIQGDLGKRAAREGWVLTLRDFITREGRMPTESEVRRLINIRDKFLMNLRDCINGRGGLMGGSLSKLGMSMAKREHDLAKAVLGPEALDWYAGKLGREAA